MYIPQIAIEGGDLTGKTTLQKELMSGDMKIGYEVFVSDRSILTHIVYSEHFKRHQEFISAWYKDLIDFLCSNGMIILTATDDTVKKRFGDRGDDKYSLAKILQINALYNKKAELLGSLPFVKVIAVDEKTVAKIVDEIKTWAASIRDRRMADQIDNLYYLIEAFGSEAGTTKELRNVRLQQHTKQLRPEQFDTLLDFYADYSKKIGGHKEYGMAIDNHAVFYRAFKEKLLYIIKKETEMYKEEPLASRRFHVTNDQGGCINTLGINFRKNANNKIDMNITANLRSSDIAILAFDLLGVYQICESIILPQTSKKTEMSKVVQRISNFYITINIDSAHIVHPEKLKEYHDNNNSRTSKK